MFDGIIVQNAYVVNDVEKAIDEWVSCVGAGPFFTRNLNLMPLYRGKETPLDMDFAVGQAGGVQIELVKVNGTEPNVYTDTYPKGSRGGFHHVALFHKDLDAVVRTYGAKGYEKAMDVVFGSTRVVYMDARKELGCMVEFYDDTDEIRGFYKMVADAAKNWDGRDRIRPF
jgi:hypothetical protein